LELHERPVAGDGVHRPHRILCHVLVHQLHGLPLRLHSLPRQVLSPALPFPPLPHSHSLSLRSYHAIHDPSILIVSSQTMLEGALDIVSAASLLSLANYDRVRVCLLTRARPFSDLPPAIDPQQPRRDHHLLCILRDHQCLPELCVASSSVCWH
jgi:hypothetical protein